MVVHLNHQPPHTASLTPYTPPAMKSAWILFYLLWLIGIHTGQSFACRTRRGYLSDTDECMR
jgi:hypothetical protein